jgi:two-component system sensor histidine kinase KdpD
MTIQRNAQADALLEALDLQAGGRLTVFLGAAPGVGKTYAMLSRAHELQRQGMDIVVGMIETHGRHETEVLIHGLSVIPRQRLAYQGRFLEEMDLDAILQRHPKAVLVDEFAHRNIPGSRHERRWQDVMELLDAGIDVYTTVNIQHLESLNDVVYQITGIRVSETIPDMVFGRLRDIRLVDLPARELIERLNQGKVYVPEQIPQALQGFFSPFNLTALRELAMQTVAGHVDLDLKDKYLAQGQAAIPVKNHIMIAIDGQGHSEYLVRMGSRMAERRAAIWTVVTVEAGHALAPQRELGKKQQQASQQRLLELDQAFSLARQLGGNTATLYGQDIVRTLLDAAADRGVSNIVIGRSKARSWKRFMGHSLTQRLLKSGQRYELTVLASFTRPPRHSRVYSQGFMSGLAWPEMAQLSIITLAGILLAVMSEQLLGVQDLSVIFMLTVLVVASRTRMLAAIISALICFLAYNFFFIEPRFTLQIAAQQGVITVLSFLAAALIASRLAVQLRVQILSLRAANTQAVRLQDLGRQLTMAADLGQVIHAGVHALQHALAAEVWIRVGDKSGSVSAMPKLTDKDRIAADWCQTHQQACGQFTDTLSASTYWFVPLKLQSGQAGVVAIKMTQPRLRFEQQRLAEAMIEDIAQAIMRTQLVTELETARVSNETEKLRSALLSSVSHDLRSPLASMIGSADSLANYGQAMNEDDKYSLLQTIRLEGERLDRYIQNLLDMTRLGHQGLTLSRDWIGVDELIGSATRRLSRYQPKLRFDIHVPQDLPQLYVHPALIEQALFNVIENAAKFSPIGQPVTIYAVEQDDQCLRIDVMDQGAGIPEAEREAIFDMFYSMQRGDRGSSGTGLGLAIVKAIVGAHMGTIEALPLQATSGTLIRMTLPVHAHEG